MRGTLDNQSVATSPGERAQLRAEMYQAFKDIRLGLEQLRDGELRRHRAWLDSLEPANCGRIEALTRDLINELLHRVLFGLRESPCGTSDPSQRAEIARRLLSGEHNQSRVEH